MKNYLLILLLMTPSFCFSAEKTEFYEVTEQYRDTLVNKEITQSTGNFYGQGISTIPLFEKKEIQRGADIYLPRTHSNKMPNPILDLNFKGGLISLDNLFGLITKTIGFSLEFIDNDIKNKMVKIGLKKMTLNDYILTAERSAMVIINQYPESRLIQIMGVN